MLAIILTSLLVVVLSCAYYPWWRYRRARKLLAHVPSMKKLPVLGNAHQMIGDGEHFLQIFSIISSMMDVLRTNYIIWLGPVPFLFLEVTDPQDLKNVVTTYMDKPIMYSFSKNIIGKGLITAPGSLWKHTSRKLAGAFSGSVVAGYQDILSGEAQKLVSRLMTEVGKGPFDVNGKYINWMTMEAIYYTTFGLPVTSECDFAEEYHKAFKRALQLYCKRGIFIHLYPDFIFNLTADSKNLKNCEKLLNNSVKKLLDQRRLERERMKNESESDDKKGFKPYIDILLELGETDPLFTEEQIIAELNTIIAAGHETVANTLAFCFIMIGSYPAIQDKLYAEMRNIFGDSKRPVTKDDLVQMKYCEAFVNEVLRLYPAAPIVFRHAHKDLDIKQCTIPKGTICGINIWAAGRSKRLWGDDAETFRPERWLEREASEQCPFYMPFSYGKRICIGKKYSMALLKTTLAHCVREFSIKADARSLRLRVYVTLQAFRGHEIELSLRE